MDVRLTLGIEEVLNRNAVIFLVVDSGVLEHLLDVRLRSDAHILLAEVLAHRIDIGHCELLSERGLLQWHLVNASVDGAKQRSCGEECAFHDCDLFKVLSLSKR